MFTLIGLGTGVAYLYSLGDALAPQIFPAAFRDPEGSVALYFEAAAVIVTLPLHGQMLELHARSRPGAAIHALLGLAPKAARRFSQATMANICQNLFFALVYNGLGVPIAAGAMSFSSVSVISNALRLRRLEL